jgi:hypothetical protein
LCGSCLAAECTRVQRLQTYAAAWC